MITFILAVCGNVDYVYSFPQSPPSRAAWIEMVLIGAVLICFWSPPSRAAWIEIFASTKRCCRISSPPSRAAWIEMVEFVYQANANKSPPSRAAWIEIKGATATITIYKVAAFTGGVD